MGQAPRPLPRLVASEHGGEMRIGRPSATSTTAYAEPGVSSYRKSGKWEIFQKIQSLEGSKFQNPQIRISKLSNNETHISKHIRLWDSHISNQNIVCTWLWISWILKSILGLPESRRIGFGSRGHVRQVRKPWKWRVFEFPKTNLNIYSSKLKQNNSAELLDHFLYYLQ